jgi:hypothetical protein
MMQLQRRYFFSILLLVSANLFGQKEEKRTVCCCSGIIEQLSQGWKKEIWASGGYRFANYKSLFTCKIDSVKAEYVLKKFDKPASHGVSPKEISYLYYFFDSNAISKKELEDIIGIKLVFNRINNALLSIGVFLYDF